MKSNPHFKWRERAEQKAAAKKSAKDVQRAYSHKIILISGSLVLLALFTFLVTFLISDARDSIVAAINHTYTQTKPIRNVQYLPINSNEIEKIGTFSQTLYAMFLISSFIAIVLFLLSSILGSQRESNSLDYVSKIASIISAICAVLFGITATFQAWKQIALAQSSSTSISEVVITVRGPNNAQPVSNLLEIDSIGPFPTAMPLPSKPILPPSLEEMVCLSRKKIEKLGTTSLLVVGRHDRQPFNNSVQAESNAALAQRRADIVANYLQGKACGYEPRRITVVTVIGGPRIEGFPASPEPDDRSVEIFAITTNSSSK